MKSLILIGIAVTGVAGAQTIPAVPAAAPSETAVVQPAVAVRGVLAKTEVDIAIDAALNSKTSKIGDAFPIHLAAAVLDASGAVLIPAGTAGQGEVVHAAKARMMGKAGEMILAVRFLQCGDTRIPLGHFKFATAGEDKSQLVGIASAALSPVFMFMSGGDVTVPVGTRAKAKITADVAMTVEVTAACGAATSSTSEGKGSQ